MLSVSEPTVGKLIRGWRRRRALTRMAPAGDSAVSTRYLSLIETGRARRSREMVQTEGVAPSLLEPSANFSTVTTFGTASDVTLAELTIEAFYPAAAWTKALLSRERP